MKKSVVQKSMKNVRNPIGIIGIFLVLVEVIAAMVVINSSLNDTINLILILFIVIFPILVLGVFYNLVTKHHEKLYSPSDYQDENNFVKTYDKITQNEILIPQSSDSTTVSQNLTEKDMVYIKESLKSILSVQESLFVEKDKMILLDETYKNIDELWDSYTTSPSVFVSNMRGCKKLIEKLTSQGYDATVYKKKYIDIDSTGLEKYSEHESIWLGCEVSVEIATEVIEIAKSIFPHLKYISINDNLTAPEEVFNQIYIGGSTATAKREKLKMLSDDDFKKLYKISNKDDLHNYVNSFKN